MKNFLIVLAVLFGCFLVAVYLVFFGSLTSMPSRQIAEWRVYGDPSYMIAIFPDVIYVDEINMTGQPQRYTEKGTWRAHSFYCDSHLDAPAEIAVASEQGNEDLELDIGFLKGGPSQKLTAVKILRGNAEFHPYPTYSNNDKVTYPPPRGLVHPGMLEADLQTLPWRPDRIDINPDEVQNAENAYQQGLPMPRDDNPTYKELYTYHSDRADLPQLRVTVEEGRVTRVEGGAEDTDDVPYQVPSPPAREDGEQPEPASHASWIARFFFWLLSK